MFLSYCIIFLEIYIEIKMNAKNIWYLENILGNFQEEGQYIAYGSAPRDVDFMGGSSYNQIQVDLTTTFTILIGIFFPSVTGKINRGCRSRQ
jgi:hypothetical protein